MSDRERLTKIRDGFNSAVERLKVTLLNSKTNNSDDTAESIQLLEKHIAELDAIIRSVDAGAPG